MNVPALHGNWVDLAIILVIFFYLWNGWGRGFILGSIDLGGFLLSFFAAIKFYAPIGTLLVANFSFSHGISNAAGFLLGGIFAEILFSTIINICSRKFYHPLVTYMGKIRILNWVVKSNQYLGFLPALGEAVIFIAFVLTLILTLPIQGVVKKDLINSRIGGSLVARTQYIERQINTIFGAAVNETLTFFTINPTSGERVKLGYTTVEVKVDEIAEATMLALVNQERTSRGLKSLSFFEKNQTLARDYAKDMFARGYFSHYNPENLSPFDRMKKAGIVFGAAGENLALAPNVYLAHQGLMNSPGHRANILSTDYQKIGIGVIDGGIYGEMFVQEFTD